MKLEAIRLKNFKAFKDAEFKDIPKFAVIIGANGTGKSTLFELFRFLQTALTSNVNKALEDLGGFREVRSRESRGPIEIKLNYIEKPKGKKFTYTLRINEKKNDAKKLHDAYVEHESLVSSGDSSGSSFVFFKFSRGKGTATIEFSGSKENTTIKIIERFFQSLKSDDILVIRGLTVFKKFAAATALGDFIENWHISYLNVRSARYHQNLRYSKQLSSEGENLASVVQHLYDNHKDIFNEITEQLKQCLPGITKIEATTTPDGRVLLKFQDGAFKDPFLAPYVSDGSIKMLAYLVMLYSPQAHPMLCIEEPENQLYHTLLEPLAEEFANYAHAEKGRQVFVTTHSPEFLNAVLAEEVYWLHKKDGYTKVYKLSDSPQIQAYMKKDGSLDNVPRRGISNKKADKAGHLWDEGFFEGLLPWGK